MRERRQTVLGLETAHVVQQRLIEAPGKRSRFEMILERHNRRLRRVVAGTICDANRVDDVLQEAYLKAYRRLPRHFSNEAHEAAWLYQVVYHCCLDELRRKKRNRETATESPQLHLVSSDGVLGRLAVEDAFSSLAASDRAVLMLCGFVGLDSHSAAVVLGIPRGTVAWRLSEARNRFRRALAIEGGADV